MEIAVQYTSVTWLYVGDVPLIMVPLKGKETPPPDGTDAAQPFLGATAMAVSTGFVISWAEYEICSHCLFNGICRDFSHAMQ